MEQKKQVVVVDIGDYYAFIDYDGSRYFYGCSSNKRLLFDSAMLHAKTYCKSGSEVSVMVMTRTSLGVRPYCDLFKSIVVRH